MTKSDVMCGAHIESLGILLTCGSPELPGAGSSPVPERSVGGHVDGQTDRQADRQNDILTCTCWHCLPVWQPAREKKRHCKRVGDNNQPLSFFFFIALI